MELEAEFLTLKQRILFFKQTTHRRCNIRRIFQTEAFPYRYNDIHKRQFLAPGAFFLKETFV